MCWCGCWKRAEEDEQVQTIEEQEAEEFACEEEVAEVLEEQEAEEVTVGV